jgi:hypothetical protein
MRLSCREALHYLVEGERCRAIAAREALTLPGSDPKDLLQTAAANLLRTWRRRCPAWAGCPARDGAGPTPCLVPPGDGPGDGAAYVRQSLRYAIRNERQGSWRRPWLDGSVLAGGDGTGDGDGPDPERSQLFADPGPPVAETAQVELLCARLALDVDRLAAGEPLAVVWPGVADKRLELKAEAADLLFGGEAVDGRHALRLLRPAFYGDPVATGEHSGAQRQRATRDGADVHAICRSVWARESEGEG